VLEQHLREQISVFVSAARKGSGFTLIPGGDTVTFE
jgi:hypothetical protein